MANTNSPDSKYLTDDQPIYTISAAARMTGIQIATLRAWERRYSFPHASRTSGRHRLYSEKEIRRLRWVKARLNAGLRAGQAIQALRHLEEQGGSPEVALPPSAIMQPEAPPPSLAVFRERLISALLAHEVEKADQVLAEVLALYPLENLVLGIIGPALVDIGQAWLDGRITVATEHLTTYYLRHRLLMWMETGPSPYAIPPIVLACAPGELHEGSLLMMGVLLRRQRWPVVYLGQSVPLPDLAAFVREIQPIAVVLVAMLEESARALAEWPQWLSEAAHSGYPLICYGGHIFTQQPEWRQRVPGIFLGATLQEGLEMLQRHLHNIVSPSL